MQSVKMRLTQKSLSDVQVYKEQWPLSVSLKEADGGERERQRKKKKQRNRMDSLEEII